MNTRHRIILVAAVVALLAGSVLAQPGDGRRHGRGAGPGGWGPGPEGPGRCPDGWGPGPEMRMEWLTERLDLSEEQVAAIEGIRDRAREDGLELRKELARLQNERRGEMLKDEPSEETIVSLTREMGELRTRLQVIRAKTRLAVREEFTEEQRDRCLMMGGRGRSMGHGFCDGPWERGARRGGRGFRQGNR